MELDKLRNKIKESKKERRKDWLNLWIIKWKLGQCRHFCFWCNYRNWCDEYRRVKYKDRF